MSRSDEAAEQGDEADEAGASDGASQLIPVFDGRSEAMTNPRQQEALQLFDALQAQFPNLRMFVDPADSVVEVSVEILTQNGLAFDVHLNLENGDDELRLAAGEAFWYAWFPSSDPVVRRFYKDAVAGLLSGDHRIVEYRRWGRPVKADLQKPSARGWETIARSRRGLLPVSWGAQRRVLQNHDAVEQGDEADER